MNNAQFRKLLETPRPPSANGSSTAASSTAASLGSKKRSSIPMTPRSVSGSVDFARQLAAHNASFSPKPDKKFRSSAAPLGTRLAEGYTDRTKAREANPAANEREIRLAALHELFQEGQIEREEYMRQTQLLGGDVKSTHLVKGLDFALLKRVREGENVMEDDDDDTKEDAEEMEEREEEELDKALERDVVPVEREKKKKPSEAPAKPKTRAEILAELKKSRLQAKEPPASILSSKFKKITDPKQPKEKQKPNHEKVRHVMGADGRVKKKIKRSDSKKELDEPVATSAPLGMMPPPPKPDTKNKPPQDDDDDDDIFAGAGAEYDPLAGLRDDSESSSDDEEADVTKPPPQDKQELIEPSLLPSPPPPPPPTSSMPPPPPPPKQKPNYFNESPTSDENTPYQPPTSASSLLSSNPDLAAALAKASKLASLTATASESADEKRRKALLESHDRDAADIDFGFGGSRDFRDDDDDDDGEFTGKKKATGVKRKRGGGKKKKGDKNDAEVVGRIVEERFGKGGKK